MVSYKKTNNTETHFVPANGKKGGLRNPPSNEIKFAFRFWMYIFFRIRKHFSPINWMHHCLMYSLLILFI